MAYIPLGQFGSALYSPDTISADNIRGGTITAQEIIIGGGSEGVIRTANYDTAVGWAIFGDGTAYFGNAVTFGDGTESIVIDGSGWGSTQATIVFNVGATSQEPEITGSKTDGTLFLSAGGAVNNTQVKVAGGIPHIALEVDGSNRLTVEAGDVTASVPVHLPDGSAAAPALAFSGATTTGLYRGTGGQWAVATGGTFRFGVDSSGVFIRTDGNRAGELFVSSVSSVLTVKLNRDTSTTTAGVLGIYSDVTADNTLHALCSADGDWTNTNGTYGMISDRRLKVKSSIKNARPYLADLRKLKVRNYRFKRSPVKLLGFVAQEVQEVMPGLVKESHEDGQLSVKTTVMIPMLVSAVQELADKVDVLEAQLAHV